jgi:hypothetical protein
VRGWLGALAALGAPLAWAAQHVIGFALGDAECGTAGQDLAFGLWTVVVMAAAAAVALAGGGAAVVAYRATRGAGDELPAARIRFLAVIGLAITPLFLALILMNGIGALVLPGCRQS